MAKRDSSKMSGKKRSRAVFLGMFLPLFILTISSCGFFYYISDQILRAYMKSQLELSVEKLNGTVAESMQSIIINVDNYVTLAADIDDDAILDGLIKIFAGKLDKYASMLYYAPVKKLSDGGKFINNLDWVPPSNFEPSERVWFKQAVQNQGQITFSTPYVDVNTGKLCVAVSKAVVTSSGKLKGVIGCDILLDTLITTIKEVQISKNGRLDLITSNGYFLTNDDPSYIMVKNWKEVTEYPNDFVPWMNGETKTFLDKKNYYAICKIGNAPWFIVVEGPILDFKGILANVLIVMEFAMIAFSLISTGLNINTLRKMTKDEQELGARLFEETQTLVVAAKENAATSQDQSAAVKEIVATMEDSNALSESISSKIKDVSKIAEKTSQDVADGVASIEQNVSQLHEIFNANQQTIDGMKVLSDKIESIWDIVTLINNVADQAKIIAFNAELEASSAGEAGKSFRIVANEIRRLSDGIIDGTKEIKEKINEIQHSSDSLILASESGTEKINAGYENAKSLEDRFASIKDSAEITANSAGDITDIIQQQTNASEQILIALKQISAGVENFTVATDNISSSSENIRAMSEQMNKKVNATETTKRKGRGK